MHSLFLFFFSGFIRARLHHQNLIMPNIWFSNILKKFLVRSAMLIVPYFGLRIIFKIIHKVLNIENNEEFINQSDNIMWEIYQRILGLINPFMRGE